MAFVHYSSNPSNSTAGTGESTNTGSSHSHHLNRSVVTDQGKSRQNSITSLFRSNSNLSSTPDPHHTKHSRTNSFNKRMSFNFKNPFKSSSATNHGEHAWGSEAPNGAGNENGGFNPSHDPKKQVPKLKLDTKVGKSSKNRDLQPADGKMESQGVANGVQDHGQAREDHKNEEDDEDEEEEEEENEVTELTEEDNDDASSSDSDSVSTNSSVNSQSYEEDEQDYCQGGYHPTFIGEVYGPKKNYKIVRKLGWGHFSTVWLAYDMLQDVHVAMKIVRSAKHYTEAAIDEVKILTKINDGSDKHPGKHHIVKLVDYFSIKGPNGAHMCMCFEVLGENMLNLIKKFKNYQRLNEVEEIYGGLPIPLVKHITRQLLLALDYLHVECGLIHTDIKPENVLIEIKDVERLLRLIDKNQDGNSKRHVKNQHSAALAKKKMAVNSRPTFHRSRKSVSKISDSPIRSSKPLQSPLSTEEIFHRSSVVSTPIMEEQMSCLRIQEEQDEQDDLQEAEEAYDATELISVKIADLGNACWNNLHYTDDIQTRQYRSPEIILRGDWGCSTDIWSLGCLIFELITSDYLFDPKVGPTYDKDDDHLAQIIELLNRWPKERFLRRCEFTPKYISVSSKSMRLKKIKNLKIWTLENVLKEKYHINDQEAAEITGFIDKFLQFEPEERMDSSSLLNHEWLATKDAKTLLPKSTYGTKGEHIKGWSGLAD